MPCAMTVWEKQIHNDFNSMSTHLELFYTEETPFERKGALPLCRGYDQQFLSLVNRADDFFFFFRWIIIIIIHWYIQTSVFI